MSTRIIRVELRAVLPERLERVFFELVDVEHAVEPGYLEQIPHPLCQFAQLAAPVVIRHRHVAADEFADTGAIHKTDAGKVDHDFQVPLGREFAHLVMKGVGGVPERDSSGNVDDSDVAGKSKREDCTHPAQYTSEAVHLTTSGRPQQSSPAVVPS